MRGGLVFIFLAACGDPEVAILDASPDVPRPPLTFATVATIPHGMFDTPRTPTGLTVVAGKLLVGLSNIHEREVATIDSAGAPATYAVGDPAYGTSILGLASSVAGDVYFASSNAFRAERPPPSFIYRIPPGGGAPVPLANLGMIRPRGIDVDGSKLFVAAPYGVYEVDAAGNTSLWAQSPLFNADDAACGVPRPLCDAICALDAGGAQGITHDENYRYVTEPDHGAVVRIPINPDGTAGTPESLATSCSQLSGILGIAVVSPGVLIGVVGRPHSAIVEIRGDDQPPASALNVGHVETLHTGDPLGLPYGIVRDGDRWIVTDWAGPNDQGRVLSVSVP